MRALLFFHPTSIDDQYRNALKDVLVRFQQNDYEISLFIFTTIQDIDYKLKNIKEDDYHKVIIIGGDGMIHVVLHELIANNVQLPVGLLPLGKETELAKLFNIPQNLDDMVSIALNDYYTVASIATDIDGVLVDGKSPTTLQSKNIRINTKTNDENLLITGKNVILSGVKNAFNKIGRIVIVDLGIVSTAKEVGSVVREIPRHSAFRYINRSSLPSAYFQKASNHLNNGYLYIVLSRTGSAAGELIRKITRKEFSHTSLSFDEGFETLVSYNGGEHLFNPGLNWEMLASLKKSEEAEVLVYRIKATIKQKQKVLQEIKKINQQGSGYNILGLFFPISPRKNIMFCSQFVYTMLKVAGLAYFEKKATDVKPMDFIDLAKNEEIELVGRFSIRELMEVNNL